MNYKYLFLIFVIILIIIFIYIYYFDNYIKICLISINNEYDGYNLQYKGEHIDKINLNEINARQFFERYIIKRKPAFFNSTIKGKFNKWNNSYLKKIIGNNNVLTMLRGNTKTLKFYDFINYIENGNNKYYMNVQPFESKIKNEPYLLSPLLKKLYKLNELPIIPSILGNIIPFQINIWMGGDNTKSRLHHDYHDNLYIVIKGKKIIKLYSPADADNLYTRGCISKIHKNGLIEYSNMIQSIKTPDHFSNIDLDQEKSEIYKKYNKFINAKETICEINEGEMIFIPCGWFHQVTSLNNKLTNENHIAISYWCYSPDLLNKESFDYPYSDKGLKYYFNNKLKNI
jgi:hypothetical protein